MSWLKWIKDLFNPLSKCERYGHVRSENPMAITIRTRSQSVGVMADEYICYVHYCKHCRVMLESPLDSKRIQTDSYGIIVMSPKNVENIDKYGYTIMKNEELFKDPYNIAK